MLLPHGSRVREASRTGIGVRFDLSGVAMEQ
jgi:hypothetical protein